VFFHADGLARNPKDERTQKATRPGLRGDHDVIIISRFVFPRALLFRRRREGNVKHEYYVRFRRSFPRRYVPSRGVFTTTTTTTTTKNKKRKHFNGNNVVRRARDNNNNNHVHITFVLCARDIPTRFINVFSYFQIGGKYEKKKNN